MHFFFFFETTFIKAVRVREDGLKEGFENRRVSEQKRGEDLKLKF